MNSKAMTIDFNLMDQSKRISIGIDFNEMSIKAYRNSLEGYLSSRVKRDSNLVVVETKTECYNYYTITNITNNLVHLVYSYIPLKSGVLTIEIDDSDEYLFQSDVEDILRTISINSSTFLNDINNLKRKNKTASICIEKNAINDIIEHYERIIKKSIQTYIDLNGELRNFCIDQNRKDAKIRMMYLLDEKHNELISYYYYYSKENDNLIVIKVTNLDNLLNDAILYSLLYEILN